MPVRYCSKCVYPDVAAVPLTFDEDFVCSACRVSAQRYDIDWGERMMMLRRLVEEYRSASNYDIIIPVSGGKDSYWQTHVATKILGLKPLLVTYHGNNYLPEGEHNLSRMREIFDCDHVIFRSSQDVCVKMSRLGLRVQGDNNWHCHCGIYTVPFQVAVRYKVPIVMFGEQCAMELAGMFSYGDFPEFTQKYRHEHSLRGFDWYDFTDEGLEKLGFPEYKEGLTPKDLLFGQFPTDDEIDAVGVRGIYLGLFMEWLPNKHTKLMMDLYDWQPARQPFERTYRTMSNLDDMHENGVHDWLKFCKLGYGRGSDHSSKDVRMGLMSREQAIEMVRKYDAVKPQKDLKRLLEYTGMSMEEFDYVCDTWRDPRVWRIENGQWVKDNIWGGSSNYGPVQLPKANWERYINFSENGEKIYPPLKRILRS